MVLKIEKKFIKNKFTTNIDLGYKLSEVQHLRTIKLKTEIFTKKKFDKGYLHKKT